MKPAYPANFALMPTFRRDLTAMSPYMPGKSAEQVAREIGMDPNEIIKLASNESPEGPFPGVAEAVAAVLEQSHRYPEDDQEELAAAAAKYVGVPIDHLWFGNGSVSLLGHIALMVGGPGTSSVYGWPSFVMYDILSRWAMTDPVAVPLDDRFRFDLDAIRASMRDDTTVVYLCNPNNPTGTIVPADDIEAFIASIPDSVLVVVDEAYHEFVADPAYRTAVPVALERDNVIVLRTFSKVFGLAAHRLGYGIAHPETLEDLRKAQAPVSVTTVSQAAGAVSLGQTAEIERRVAANAAARHQMLGVVAERGLDHAHSETNFVFFRLDGESSDVAARFEYLGVIIRPMAEGWQRVTIGSEEENAKFVAALDTVIDNL